MVVRASADSLLSKGLIEQARWEVETVMEGLSGDDLLACRNLLAKIERAGGNPERALTIHLETYPLVEQSSAPVLKARFHNGLGITYRMLAVDKPEYLDRALIAYEACKFHAQEAGDEREAGGAINNIAMVLCQAGRTEEAHTELERARTHITDPVILAQIDETSAQVFLKENKPTEALSRILSASNSFAVHGEKKLLDDSLRTLLKATSDYLCVE